MSIEELISNAYYDTLKTFDPFLLTPISLYKNIFLSFRCWTEKKAGSFTEQTLISLMV